MRQFVVRRAARLDQIARDVYGSETGGGVEAILEANAALAGRVGLIPEGTVLLVPEVASSAVAVVRPWI